MRSSFHGKSFGRGPSLTLEAGFTACSVQCLRCATGSSNARAVPRFGLPGTGNVRLFPIIPQSINPNLGEPNTGGNRVNATFYQHLCKTSHASFEIEFVAQSLPLELKRGLGRGAFGNVCGDLFHF